MKTVVVTGANRGIGLALTKEFAKDSFVYALCRSEFPPEELNDNIKVLTLDVTNEAAIASFAAELNDKNVGIDLLVNNAGMAGGDENKNLKDDAHSVTELFAVNTVAPMILSIHLAPAMNRAERPVMIAISSRMGSHALLNKHNAEWWPYGASKAGLSFAVSAFAINEPAIKSISVHPGWVKTRMGGDGADIEPAESAKGIAQLYETIDSLESGRLYTYDGKLLDW